MIEAFRAIVDKRDQRVYLPTPIPPDALRRILQAGRMTGSSKNREPNRLIVVSEREGVRALGALSEWGKWLAHAAVVIVIAQVEPHEFDAGRCAQNMMLAAWADGIGSCPAHLPEAEVARQPRDRLRLRRSRARRRAEGRRPPAQAARGARPPRAVVTRVPARGR